MDPPRSEDRTRVGDEDELASELLFSVREVGVACFPIPEPEVDEGRAD